MFDLGWPELLLVAAVALIVVGPKDLPQAVRTVTQLIRRVRGMAREFQSSLDDLARETGVDEIKKDLNEFQADYDPAAALESIADADGELSGAFDDIDKPAVGNSIEPPKQGDDQPPPDLTPTDFGALDGEPPTPSETPDTAAAEPSSGEPSSDDVVPDKNAAPKRDGDAV